MEYRDEGCFAFNVGDRVIIHRPDNGRKNFPDEPTWVSHMDEYDGTIQYISRVYRKGKEYGMVGQLWSYGASWLSPVVTEDDFEAEDLGCLI